MPDRVRKAVFDTLGSALAQPGRLPPAAVLDLFAGSGAVGIEALSRGATFCCFVEAHSSAIQALRSNLQTLGLTEQAEILRADALRVQPPRPPQEHYAIVFVDPPYPLSRCSDRDGPVGRLLRELSAQGVLDEAARILLRHEAQVRYDRIEYGRLQAYDVRRYGKMAITFFHLIEPSDG